MNAKTVTEVFKILILSIGLFYFTACQQAKYSEDIITKNTEIDKEYAAESKNESSTNNSQLPEELKIIKSV